MAKRTSAAGRLIRFLLVVALLFVTAGAAFFGYAQYMASRVSLPPLKIGDSSVILASDGKTELGHIASAGKSHISLTDDQVSPLLKQAHLAAEDRSFFVHGAVSPQGMAFALFKDLLSHSFAAGGSTITQQYVKNAYLTQEKTADRKTDEIIYSYKVQKELTKDQILTKYLNSNYYGRGAYGVEDAAQVWFGVSAAELKDANDPLQVARAAFLAALVRQPSTFAKYDGAPSNLVNSKSLYQRVNYVLDGLGAVEGMPNTVSPGVIAQAKQLLPLKLTDTVGAGGTALDGDPYLVDYTRDWLTAWQTQVAKDDGYSDSEAQEQGTATAEAMLTRGGMRIVTTLDPNLNRQLADAVAAELPHRGLSAGAVIQDPRTGAIVAMYPGKNHDTDQYNYALYANRQVGSVMKTTVLSDAVQRNISVQSELPAPNQIVVNGFTVHNDSTQPIPGCRLNLADAIALSNNPVHVELITGQMASCQDPAQLTPIEPNYPVSPASVAELARKMGADDSVVPGATNPAQLPEVPALALGVGSLTPPKVATIGSTLANGGMHNKPYVVTSITAQDSTVVYQHTAEAPTQALDTKSVNIVNQVLTGVFSNRGTALSAQVPGHPVAGKTGTTDSDAWGLMYSAVDPSGTTPAYTCAAWAGYPDNRDANGDLWGADVMMICHDFMVSALANVPSVDFAPADLHSGKIVGLNANSGVSTTSAPPATTDTPTPTTTTTTDEPTDTPTRHFHLFDPPTTSDTTTAVPDNSAPSTEPDAPTVTETPQGN